MLDGAVAVRAFPQTLPVAQLATRGFPPRPLSKFVLTCLSPSILGTTSAASLCSGVWGSGSAAAPPSPASTASRCKASEHRVTAVGGDAGGDAGPRLPRPGRCQDGSGGSRPSGKVCMLCGLRQIFEFIAITLEQLLSISAVQYRPQLYWLVPDEDLPAVFNQRLCSPVC